MKHFNLRLILFGIILGVLLSSSVFSYVVKTNTLGQVIFDDISTKSDFVGKYDIHNNLVNWKCDFNFVPTVLRVNDCYCLDTKSGIGKSDGLGYGDLYKCLQKSTNGTFENLEGHQKNIKLDINVTFLENQISPSEVHLNEIYKNANNIYSKGSDIECSYIGGSPESVTYTFFREKPFTILQKGYNSKYKLSNLLNNGNSVKCLVSFYDKYVVTGSKVSEENIVVNDITATPLSSYITPAYPKVTDKLICQGSTVFNISSPYIINRSLEMFSGNFNSSNQRKFNVTESELNGDDGFHSISYYGKPGEISKGDTVYCFNKLQVLDGNNNILNYTYLSSNTTIVNSRPEIPVININLIQLPEKQFDLSTHIMDFENDVGNIVGVFDESGNVALKGNLYKNIFDYSGIGSSIFNITNNSGDIVLDLNEKGSLYIRGGLNCPDDGTDVFSLSNSSNFKVLTVFGNGDLCFTGKLGRGYEFE